MTLQAIKYRVLRLIKNIGTYHGPGLEDADVCSLIDEGMARIAQQCLHYDPAITFTLSADTPTYRLESSAFGRRIAKPVRIRLNGSPLLDPRGLEGVWTAADFERQFPNFMSESSGDPQIAVWYGPILRLFPTPSTTFVSSCTGFIAAEYIPGWVDGSTYYNTASSAPATSVPDIPLEFHDLVPELAAHLGSTAVTDSEAAWGIVRHRQQRIVSQLERLRRKNRESMSATPLRGTTISRIELG